MAGADASAASAVEVSVRVEGGVSTLLESTVETVVHPVDGGDGTGLHNCRGPIGETPGPTVTGALDDALREVGKSWRGSWSSSSGDFLVTSVAGEDASPSGPWTILLNGIPTPMGGCSMKIEEGDRVLLARDTVFATKTLLLSGPSEVEPGESFQMVVEDEQASAGPVSGAEIRVSGGQAEVTGSGGRAGFTLERPGRYRFKATHPRGIRSNTFEVCVGETGCVDSGGPAVRIVDLPEGARFLRGATPRSLRGTSRKGGSIEVSIRLRGYRGKCWVWTSAMSGFSKRRCDAGVRWSSAPVRGGKWSIPTGTLPPGRYRLLARVPGQSTSWRKGINRISITVGPRRLAARKLVRAAARYLDRATRSRTVRHSGLLAGWSGIALGLWGRKTARRLIPTLKIDRLARASTSDLARNLAALVRIQDQRADPAMRRELISRQADDGSFDGNSNLTAMAIMALPGSASAFDAATWLRSSQDVSGGFGAASGAAPDTDTTGLVAWSLAASGFKLEAARAARFIRSTQNPDGGFPAVAGGQSNAQSTGLGLLAIHASGGSRLGPRTADGITPAHYLASLQRHDGSIGYSSFMRTTPVWVTSQALAGLAPRALIEP